MFNKNTFVNYDDVTGLDLNTVNKEISFPIEVEKVQSVVSNKILSKSVLFNLNGGVNKNERTPIGFISDKRKIQPYGELMDIVTSELSKITNFKLIENNISSKSCNVYQRYLIDQKITNPDGLELAPMLMVNYSYVGLPIALELGTFRYICSNGAYVKVQDFERIAIKMHDLNSLYIQNIGNLIKRGLDNINKISNRYNELASENWDKYLENILSNQRVSVAFKKSIAEYLHAKGEMLLRATDTVKNDTFLSLRYDKNTNCLIDRNREPIYQVMSSKSAWEFYNDCTDLSSHTSPSVALRKNNDLNISEIFRA